MFCRTPKSLVSVVAAIAVVVVNGCAGHNSSGLLPITQPPGTGGGASATTLRIVVDAPSSAAASRTAAGRPQWIDPLSTRSIAFQVFAPNHDPVSHGSGYVNLSATSTTCTQSGNLKPLTCTFNLPGAVLPAKETYTIDVVAYDQYQTRTCSTPGPPACVGNVSRATVAQVLTPGANNTVSLVLGGVPATVAVTPMNRGYLQGSLSGLKLWGASAQYVVIQALDKDGNAIIGSSADGAPTISLTSQNAGQLTASLSGVNKFALTAVRSGSPAVVSPGVVQLTVTVKPATVTGGPTITQQVPIRIGHSSIYAAEGTKVSILYDGNIVPSVTITQGFTSANGVAVDSAGTMYVCDETANDIEVYPAGNTTPVRKILPGGGATAPCSGGSLTVDSAGKLYALDTADGGIVNEYRSGSSVLSSQYAPPGHPRRRGKQ